MHFITGAQRPPLGRASWAEMTALVWLGPQEVLGIPESPSQGRDDGAYDKQLCPITSL